MSEIVMRRADARTLLHHLALYGLGAILDEAGVPDVRISWTPGMQPLPRLTGTGLSRERLDEAVRAHAQARATETSWLHRDVELSGTPRGLMSPRLSTFPDAETWARVQAARHDELDLLTDAHAWTDLRFLAALGEPCYWSRNRQDVTLQDDGASRLEMQPRNQGSEFVKNRLRKLADALAARAPGAAAAGLDGSGSRDEVGEDALDSRTPTGLASRGPTDNALAWCALWGIAAFPTVARVNATAQTSGHIGRSRSEWFYTPVWERPWRLSRLRTVLAARQLRDLAASALPAPWAADAEGETAARSWLAARGVIGLVRFPIQRFGSDSAPERRAMRGTTLPTEVPT
jgi:CRISPR-associated protein Csb3